MAATFEREEMRCPLCSGNTTLTKSRANGAIRQRACMSDACRFTFQTREQLTLSAVGYARAARADKAREYLRAAGVLE